ncbi:MAG: glycogen/starch synthase [Saprospiraceae bacterium]
MSKLKLLVVTQELDPYTELSEIASLVSRLPQYAQDKGGFELRVLMPRYSSINERRHRLHEVVRLSGMNIIIDDDDYPLVIKVASMPNSRMQVYFLENEDYFKRKNLFADENGVPFEDNHERMIFFGKGVLEIVKKFGWSPDIIHCHGWLTGMLPLFVKNAYAHEPIFKNSKVIYSAYNSTPEMPIAENFVQKAAINGMDTEALGAYMIDNKLSIDAGATLFADGIIMGSETYNEALTKILDETSKPLLEHQSEEGYLPAYMEFYNHLLAESVAE